MQRFAEPLRTAVKIAFVAALLSLAFGATGIMPRESAEQLVSASLLLASLAVLGWSAIALTRELRS